MTKYLVLLLVGVSFFSFNVGADVEQASERVNYKGATTSADGNNLESESANNDFSLDSHIVKLYQEMGLKNVGLDLQLFKTGYVGFMNLKNKGEVQNNVLTLIDFGKPSTEKRMWIIDLDKKSLIEHTLVAHGKNSGNLTADNFSNLPNSNMSSLGFYVTSETYHGKHGLSLRIKGMDPDFNSKAFDRAVVLHGADYVSENFIKETGRLGRSHGCPAVPVEKTESIIETVKGGSVIFIWHPEKNFHTSFVDMKVALNVVKSYYL